MTIWKRSHARSSISAAGMPCLLLMLACAIPLAFPSHALAADAASYITFGSQIDATGFTPVLREIASGMREAGKAILIIMTVAAGIMVCLGIDSGRKLAWQYMLGIGLALNVGDVLLSGDLWGSDITGADVDKAAQEAAKAASEALTDYHATSASVEPMGAFLAYYKALITAKAMPVMQAIAIKLTLVLAVIEAGYRFAFEINESNKVKQLVALVMKLGFCLYLITNWWPLATALSEFFQQLGFQAGGTEIASLAESQQYSPDNIWLLANMLWELTIGSDEAAVQNWIDKYHLTDSNAKDISAYGILSTSLFHAGIGQVIIFICLIACVAMIFFTALEVFIVNIEFITMVTIGVVMLPFLMVNKLEFLFRQTISSVMNIAVKVMVISFLQAIIAKMLILQFVNIRWSAFKDGYITEWLFMLLICLLFAFLVRRLPDMTSSFLAGGSFGLSSQAAVSDAKKAAELTVKVGRAIATKGGSLTGELKGAMAASAAQNGGKATFGGTMSALGKSYAAQAISGSSFMKGAAKGSKFAIGKDGQDAQRKLSERARRLAGGGKDYKQSLENAKKGGKKDDEGSEKSGEQKGE